LFGLAGGAMAQGADHGPTSPRASHLNASTARGEVAPRLPDPATSANTPEAFLAAADRALSRRQTGAAQEALERAETRLLDRSTPQGADATSTDPRVRQISDARQALAHRDVAGARSLIQAAMGGAAAPAAMPADPADAPMHGRRHGRMRQHDMDQSATPIAPMDQSQPMGAMRAPGTMGGAPATSGSLSGGAPAAGASGMAPAR